MIMRYLYTTLLYLATPFVLFKWLKRSLKDRAYGKRWGERFAYIPIIIANQKTIWLHAVSLGESIAATPLIHALLDQYPQHVLIITTTTPAGSRHIQQLAQKIETDRIYHVYAPYDLPPIIRRFLSRTHPEQVIIMETELWPNLLYTLKKVQIPTLIANARLSERSYQRYNYVRHFFKPLLQPLLIGAQSLADQHRFECLGAQHGRVIVTGNMKFDHVMPAILIEEAHHLRQAWGSRPTLIAASTHAGEEKIILDAFRDILSHYPDTLLILVPRHRERFTEVAALCTTAGHRLAYRSRAELPTPQTTLYLGDTMGELRLLYAASDIAFVGGSLIPQGGHNLIEPASLSLPILSGPFLHHFVDIRDLLLQNNALCIVENAPSLAQQVITLLAHQPAAKAYGERALAVSQANRGALLKTMSLIYQL